MLWDIAIAVVLRREDQQGLAVLGLPDAQRIFEQRLHQRPQQQFLVGTVLQPLHAGEIEIVAVDIVFRHAADFVPVGAGGADDRGRIAVEQVRPQQHQVAEFKRTHQAVIGEQRHGRAHIGLAEGLVRQRLLQPLRQFGKPQEPDVGAVPHRHDRVLDLRQEARRRGPRQPVPRDMLGDELLEPRRLIAIRRIGAIIAPFGAGGQAGGEAVLLQEAVDLPLAHRHAADIEPRWDQQLGHVALGAPARDGGAQSLEPVARLGERIILLRIDQQ